MNLSKPFLLLLAVFSFYAVFSQKHAATITGKVVDENEHPLVQVSVGILGKEKGTKTNDSGRFSITVTAGKPVALVFSYTGYKTLQRNFKLLQG